MLPSNSILGLYEHGEARFSIGYAHPEVLVGEGASDALKKNEGEIGLGVLDHDSIAQSEKEVATPDGAAGAAEDVPVGFDNVETGWAFVGFGSASPVHVSSSR